MVMKAVIKERYRESMTCFFLFPLINVLNASLDSF